MELWQRSETRDKLQLLSQKEPFFQSPPVQQTTLHLYSAGRQHIGFHGQYWKQEVFSTERQFRSDVVHDGHLSVTGLYSEKHYYWCNHAIHNVSGFHPEMQEQITKHKKFTEVLIELHERLSKTIQEALDIGRQDVHFVISCNEGCSRSVAMVHLMQEVLSKNGWLSIEVEHLHLWRCEDPYVANGCCRCHDCWTPRPIPAHIVSNVSQQWRAVCC